MSRARREIVETLHNSDYVLGDEEVERLADDLMPIVRETVARGFERAAEELENPADTSSWARFPGAAQLLRVWAVDARADRRTD